MTLKNIIVFAVVVVVLASILGFVGYSLLRSQPVPASAPAPQPKLEACGSGICVDGNISIVQNNCLSVFDSTSSPAKATFCGPFAVKFNQ